MDNLDLQKIYNEREEWYDDWFHNYKKTVSHFIDLVEKDEIWNEDDLYVLICKQNNSIADNGQWGTIYNTDKNPEFGKIKEKWIDELLPIIKDIVKNKDISTNQYEKIKETIFLCCNKKKKIAVNRIVSAFLPNRITTTVSEEDFYYVESKLKERLTDYNPDPNNNWIEGNKYFIKYCNEKVKFDDPWQCSIFNWILHDFFEWEEEQIKIAEEYKNKIFEYMENYKTLLLNNHNLILTGAPGTGKTHLAKQIAQKMIFGNVKDEMTKEEELQFNEQCGFVQFHPSYDYTDFVEGLRPKNENGNVGFERKDGVFKEFCSRALKNSFENTIDNFEETWNRLVTELSEKDFLEVSLLSGKNKFLIELNEYGDGLANRTYENDKYEKGNWVRGQSKFFSKEQCYNIYKGLPGIPSGGHDNYRKAIVNYMKSKMGLYEYKEGNMSIDNGKKYVFIIDEINRGEISKIFGELFFAIDPGYRGSEKCSDLRTQYANLQESRNAFDEVLKISDADNYGHFFVPENVYIIGTMNDIDRSVESMDFAFRRRFAFVEVKASENTGMLDGKAWKDEAIERMNSLNAAIENVDGLSSAYHIGASYFLKLENYNGDFGQLWKYHLDGLLREYLRGTQGVDEKMNNLENAYKLINAAAE